MIRVKENVWALTDASTNQQGRKLSDHEFEFKEGGMEQRKIDIRLYTDQQIEDVINPYGYTLGEPVSGKYENIKSLYGACSNWIIAECLFESEV